jgi:hydrogenase maturation protease
MMEEVLTSGVKGMTVVLGLGNLLRRDEGLGVRALHQLAVRYALPEVVMPVDGGTLGLDLISYIENAERLLVLDAALSEGPPGTLLRLEGADVPSYLGIKTSPHEIGLPDLMALTRLRGTEPGEVVVLGMQPDTIELGWELSPTIAAHLDHLVEAAADQLRAWGLELTLKAEPSS